MCRCVCVCVRSREERQWRSVSGEEQEGCSALPPEINAVFANHSITSDGCANTHLPTHQDSTVDLCIYFTDRCSDGMWELQEAVVSFFIFFIQAGK